MPNGVQIYTELSKIGYNIQHMKLLKVGLFCVLALTAFSGCTQIEDATLLVSGRDDQTTSFMPRTVRAIPRQGGMLLEWVNPDSDNITITGFNVSWQRSNVTDITDTDSVSLKRMRRDAGGNASYLFTGLMDETRAPVFCACDDSGSGILFSFWI